MVLEKLRQKEQQGRSASVPRSRASRAVVGLAAALALTMAMAVPAFAVSGQMQTRNIGTLENDIYNISVDSTAFTAPSKFWGSGTSVPDLFKVSFVNETDGSSLSFDTAHAHAGVAAKGPLYTDGSSSGSAGSYVGNITTNPFEAADVWSGDWVYAFRVCPSATFGADAAGTPVVGFNWKGCFATYFDTWDFTFDANSALGISDAAGKQVVLTYYGGYVASQTSRGTSYGADLTSTITDLSYGSTADGQAVLTADTPVGTSYAATADSQGKVTFSGIEYGGNYTITVLPAA